MSELLIPIKQYAKTAAQLATENATPVIRQLIIESDTGRIKIGDGVTAYNSLPYLIDVTTQSRAALSFTAGSGGYNSTTGVITIPTNTNQLTNDAGFISGSGTTNYLPKFTASGTVGDSVIRQVSGDIITNGATDTGEHFIIGGSARVNGTILSARNTVLTNTNRPLTLQKSSVFTGSFYLSFLDSSSNTMSYIGYGSSANENFQIYNALAKTQIYSGTSLLDIGYNGAASSINTSFSINGDIITTAPSGGSVGKWKLGVKVSATVSLVTTDYLQVEVDGVAYKLALAKL